MLPPLPDRLKVLWGSVGARSTLRGTRPQGLVSEVTAKVEEARVEVRNTRLYSLEQRLVFTTAPEHETASACERGTLQLSCSDRKTLLIVEANYGRTTASHSCACSTCRTNCRAATSLAVVRGTCQGKRQCSVTASSSVFGGDPCYGVQKYLEVSYRCITESNVALRKTASCSSAPSHWGPEKAVDGSRGTRITWYNQCTHTNRVYQPWWKVDLGGTYPVNRVSVLNRGDCCGDRLRNFMVRVGPNEDFTRNDQCGETYTATPRNGATVVVYCDQPMTGRYVSIQLIGRADNLQLCEVDVFAETVLQYTSLGCWRDSGSRAMAYLEGTNSLLDGDYQSRHHAIQKCYQVALSRDFTVFGVQHGGQCFGSADGINTYNRYGPTTTCAEDGEGGPWGNEVYKITGYTSLGCWRDSATRAIPILEGTDSLLDGDYQSRHHAIQKCYQVALSRGFTVFAVQYGGECFGSANGINTYNRYGPTTTCAEDGKGGAWGNEVYKITG
ncbi:PREDICTED: uncharacterized protein LOC109474031 [Branchiostoma belcheri]|uniref:Uncharacterized protein LOC109474031 n=1 Tax=Branchiostoma belcheri TaxID=7741 RepID=A0A6P4YK26_BRABE|nr:PREDICTED: uncharacterized protein LOC109474031 [Branchiostoma belcheri]